MKRFELLKKLRHFMACLLSHKALTFPLLFLFLCFSPANGHEDCFVFMEGRAPASVKAGTVSGKTTGVDAKLLAVLEKVAKKHKIGIYVTSGKRTADQQASAMWNNWVKLKRGDVYKASVLSAETKKKLDGHFNQAKKKEFLNLVKDKFGCKSRHCTGKAVDIRKSGITDAAYKDILKELKEVDEKRKDIYHFELK